VTLGDVPLYSATMQNLPTFVDDVHVAIAHDDYLLYSFS